MDEETSLIVFQGKDLESKSGKKVVTSENYLEQKESAKRIEKKK